MFNLFNFSGAAATSDKDESMVAEMQYEPQIVKSAKEVEEEHKKKKLQRQLKLIDQCHTEIDTAGDRLIENAKAIIFKHQQEFALEDNPSKAKADRLRALGFVQTPVQKMANEINGRNLKIKEKEAENKKAVAAQEAHIQLIEYYQGTYPFLKFLTIPEFKKILEKYGLVMAPAYRFIDEVPEKNLVEIEKAQKLNPEDVAETFNYFEVFDSNGTSLDKVSISAIELQQILSNACAQYTSYDHISSRRFSINVSGQSYAVNDYSWAAAIQNIFAGKYYQPSSFKYVERNNSGLFIAATKNELNLEGLKETDNGFVVETNNQGTIEVINRDPIVFRYVRGGVQVLTKWGPEANDPELALSINN